MGITVNTFDTVSAYIDGAIDTEPNIPEEKDLNAYVILSTSLHCYTITVTFYSSMCTKQIVRLNNV